MTNHKCSVMLVGKNIDKVCNMIMKLYEEGHSILEKAISPNRNPRLSRLLEDDNKMLLIDRGSPGDHCLNSLENIPICIVTTHLVDLFNSKGRTRKYINNNWYKRAKSPYDYVKEA